MPVELVKYWIVVLLSSMKNIVCGRFLVTNERSWSYYEWKVVGRRAERSFEVMIVQP